MNDMVKEKETKMKETLSIYGLQRSVYSLSYLLIQGVYLIITTALIVLMISVFGGDTLTTGILLRLFPAIFLLGLNYLSMALVLQNFFSNFRFVSMVGPLFIFLPTGIAMMAM